MSDPLPAWNDGETKRRVIDAVRALADEVPAEERIATLDNDGTLWCEKPAYIQAEFLVRRWRAMAEQDPARRASQPYKAAAEGDVAWFADLYSHLDELVQGVCQAYEGITPQEFDSAVREFFDSARHPRYSVPYTDVTYRPMRELLDLLRNTGFKVFIATGGGRDFVRVVSEQIYGIPREYVIGSAAKLGYKDGAVVRLPELVQPLGDGPGKPVHIFERVGRPPVFAAGNSDGDIEMLTMARVGLLIHHDDAEREYAYDAGAERSLEAATRSDWIVASMRDDFARIFDPDSTQPAIT